MPRITLHPSIEKLSGRLGKIVFCGKIMSPNATRPRQGYMRSHSNSSTHSIRQQNNRTAFQIITSTYNQIKKYPNIHKTWIDTAKSYSTHYTISPRSLFYSFFLAMWSGSGSGWWKPRDLVIVTGFGTGGFGTGGFGKITTDYSNLTWKNRFKARFT